MKNSEVIENCPICGKKVTEFNLEVRDYHDGTYGFRKGTVCKPCGKICWADYEPIKPMAR